MKDPNLEIRDSKQLLDAHISMEFAGPGEYAAYNEHPNHVRFVQDRWLPEVADFLEIDYEVLD